VIEVTLTDTRDDAQKKNSYRLSELTQDENDVKLGDVYVPKTTLMELGWKPGDRLSVKLEVV
jgi:hypothetical protein